MNPLLIIGAVAITAVVSLFWLRQPKPHCPSCSGSDVVKIREDVEEVRPYEPGPEGFGSRGQMLQMQVKTTYRCRTCEHAWQTTHIEK